jgi:hypothetical protein
MPDKTLAAQSSATAGCVNADDLIDQARDVTSKLREITPAALAANSDKLVESLRDLKGRAHRLENELEGCEVEEVNKDQDAVIEITLNYLTFVCETRFTEGDKSYLADEMPPEAQQQIPECRGIRVLLSETDIFISRANADAENIMPRDVGPLYHRAKELIDCGSALEKTSNRAAAAQIYLNAAGIDNLMVLASANSEAVLTRALAASVAPPRNAPATRPQPIIIRSGPRSCTGSVWGDGNYRAIDWSCN